MGRSRWYKRTPNHKSTFIKGFVSLKLKCIVHFPGYTRQVSGSGWPTHNRTLFPCRDWCLYFQNGSLSLTPWSMCDHTLPIFAGHMTSTPHPPLLPLVSHIQLTSFSFSCTSFFYIKIIQVIHRYIDLKQIYKSDLTCSDLIHIKFIERRLMLRF